MEVLVPLQLLRDQDSKLNSDKILSASVNILKSSI